MEFIVPTLLVLLWISISFNAYFLFFRKPKKVETVTHTQDAKDLLSQLLADGALLDIRIIDKTRFFLWDKGTRQ